ncbi:MAG TPA: outer membrane protein assembly factor BamD [Pyrinomonadaceae bacterium]|nr:outer membrane protein assembly factor BamD [Pyrinomonadaceae bacterium]
MKKLVIMGSVLLSVCLMSLAVNAQGRASRGPDPSTQREPDVEADSRHNLDVARQYFKLRKAYKASLDRCEEIMAGNPGFAHMDEVLFIAGESSLLLSQKKGKQSVPDNMLGKYHDTAREYLTKLIHDFPESQFRKQAESDLQSIGGPVTTSSQ